MVEKVLGPEAFAVVTDHVMAQSATASGTHRRQIRALPGSKLIISGLADLPRGIAEQTSCHK
jgi:hypothetical protein